MFQTELVARFHHLYFIQALVDIQRRCDKLYLRLKHKFLYFVGKRLHLNRKLKWLHRHQEQNHGDDYGFGQADESGGANILEDLNRMLRNQSQGSVRAVSVPMQMLLLPFIAVQPHGSNNEMKRVDTTPSGHMYFSNNNNINASSSKSDSSQQWHETMGTGDTTSAANNNGPHYITLVPSQIITAQPQSNIQSGIQVTNEQRNLYSTPRAGARQQRENYIQFAPNHSLEQRNSNYGSGKNSWSSQAAGQSSLTLRNPLIDYAIGSRRRS